MPPSRARNRANSNVPPSPETEARNRAAVRAYRVSLWGLIPGLGLICGPAAVVMGTWIRSWCKSDPDFSALGPLNASIGFGLFIAVVNWIGATLMIMGLSG
jgi:hypothetical protein